MKKSILKILTLSLAFIMVIVLFASCAEQIGSAVVVNGGYLIEQGIYAVKVGNLRQSDRHEIASDQPSMPKRTKE